MLHINNQHPMYKKWLQAEKTHWWVQSALIKSVNQLVKFPKYGPLSGNFYHEQAGGYRGTKEQLLPRGQP